MRCLVPATRSSDRVRRPRPRMPALLLVDVPLVRLLVAPWPPRTGLADPSLNFGPRVLALLLVLVGCGDPPFDPRSLVDGYRVVALRADLPEARPDQRVTVRVFENLPDGVEPAREWSFCVFSLGGLRDYACFDPALEIPLAETGPEVVIDLPAIFAQLAAAGDTAGGIDATGGALDLNQEGIDAYVRLRSGPADGRLESVFRVLIRTREPPNANPGLEGLRFPGFSGVVESAPVGTTLELEVVPDDEARETFDALDRRCYTKALEDGGDDEVKQAAAYERCLEATQEDLVYQWFSTGGEFSKAIALNDETETVLELPDEAGPLHVWVVVRDGRGGVAVAEHTLEVTAE